ncbi:DUF4446 family protein [Patescibacteria group bacterium]|nr:DUF4446 family protein [Patescibacteria group bacterium]
METTLLIAGIFVWLAVLTVWIFRIAAHYNGLTRGVTRTGLTEVLNRLTSTQEAHKKSMLDLSRMIKQLAYNDAFHIQKLGIVRFNPFSDTGGSQSFSLALMDGHDNGIVITSLYARTGNRWYIKEISGGKGKELELSKEEQSAIRHASAVS